MNPTFVTPKLLDQMVSIRRDLHRHPELSWKESRTQSQIASNLDKLGLSYRKIAGTGLVVDLLGTNPDAPIIALRADIDALPVEEETGLPFASTIHGVMHACGHDGHTAMLLGAANLLAHGTKKDISVRLLFQPAEETGDGAQRMIEEGALDGVAMIFGGHVDRHYPLGTIAVTDGAVNASADTFTINIDGQSGHAARPHETTDAVVVGSLLVMAIQTIVSREVNPAHPSVVTVGKFDAGTAENVIAGHARLHGTIRAQDPEVRTFLHESLRRVGASVGQLHGADVRVDIRDGPPAVINPPEPTALCRTAATSVVGSENVRAMEIANMGGEDFSYYMEQIPGCYVRFGTTTPDCEAHPAHSSRFDFDENVLGIGAAYYHSIIETVSQINESSRH